MADRILWLDLETTGTDPAKDECIEIGLLVTDGLDSEVAEFSAPIKPYTRSNPILWPQVVLDMHVASGLISELPTAKFAGGVAGPVHLFLDEHFVPGDGVITVGGSGIDRFDIPFLREARELRSIADRFHFRTLDVSSTKRLMVMAGAEVPPEGRAHRALDDARWAFHVAQAAAALLDGAPVGHAQSSETSAHTLRDEVIAAVESVPVSHVDRNRVANAGDFADAVLAVVKARLDALPRSSWEGFPTYIHGNDIDALFAGGAS